MSTLDAEILQAFPPKPLAASIFVDAQSHWNEYVHASQFVMGCEGKSWNELPIPFLSFHEDALRWLPPATFVEVMPAYLFAALNLPRDADNLITESLVMNLIRRKRWAHLFDARLDRLNKTQRELMVAVLSTIQEEDREAGDIINALDDLRTLPENDASLRMPDGPTTPVLPLPAQYAQLEHDLLAAFPPQTFSPPAIAQWKEWIDNGSQYIGNMALEEAISGKVWGALSIEFVLTHEYALRMLKPEGFAALIPTYLAALLHNKTELKSAVYISLRRFSDDDVLFATRTETLDKAQRQVIVRVFEVLVGRCERAERPLTRDADWIAMNIHSAYEGWCSVIDGPPNVKTFSDPKPPPEFETQHLLQQIREAFPSKRFSSGIFDYSTPQWCWGEDDDEKAFIEGCRGQSWDTLSPAFVEHYDDVLGWMPPEGFVAVLPAYLEMLVYYGDADPWYVLKDLIRNRPRSEPSADMDDEVGRRVDAQWDANFDAKVVLLNEQQRRVIVHVLEALVNEDERLSRGESKNARAALADWRNVLS